MIRTKSIRLPSDMLLLYAFPHSCFKVVTTSTTPSRFSKVINLSKYRDKTSFHIRIAKQTLGAVHSEVGEFTTTHLQATAWRVGNQKQQQREATLRIVLGDPITWQQPPSKRGILVSLALLSNKHNQVVKHSIIITLHLYFLISVGKGINRLLFVFHQFIFEGEDDLKRSDPMKGSERPRAEW